MHRLLPFWLLALSHPTLFSQEASVLDILTGKFSFIADFAIGEEKSRYYLLEEALDSVKLNGQTIVILPVDEPIGPFNQGTTCLLAVNSDGTPKFIKNLGFTFGQGNVVASDNAVTAFMMFQRDTFITADTFFVKTGPNNSTNMAAFQYGLDGTLANAKHWPSPQDCRATMQDAALIGNDFFLTGRYVKDTLKLDGFEIGTYKDWGLQDVFTARLDHTLNCHWLKRLGGGDDDEALGMSASQAGNVAVTGYHESNWFFCDQDSTHNPYPLFSTTSYVANINPDGSCNWMEEIYDTTGSYGTGVGFLSDGSVVASGNYYGWTVSFGGDTVLSNPAISANCFFEKYSPDGELVFATQLEGDTFQTIDGLVITPNDQIWVCGNYYSSYLFAGPYSVQQKGGGDVFVAKYDKYGNPLYISSFGGKKVDYSYQSIGKGVDNNIVFTFQSESDTVEIGGNYYYNTDIGNIEFVIEIKDTLSSIARIRDKTGFAMALYPNPAESGRALNYELTGKGFSDFFSFKLYSSYGNLIHTASGMRLGGGSLVLPNIPSGVYFLAVEDSTGQIVQVKKLVISL